MTVRGAAGGTPASAAKIPASRRESSIFGTPSVASRPPSALSDIGSTAKDRRLSEVPSNATKPGLGRSVRANGTATHTAKRSVDGAMGPPPSARTNASSVSATPTRIPSGSSVRATPSTIKAPAQRRMSASVLEQSKLGASTSSSLARLKKLPSVSSTSETDEKENSLPSPSSSTSSKAGTTSAKATRRMSAVPA